MADHGKPPLPKPRPRSQMYPDLSSSAHSQTPLTVQSPPPAPKPREKPSQTPPAPKPRPPLVAEAQPTQSATPKPPAPRKRRQLKPTPSQQDMQEQPEEQPETPADTTTDAPEVAGRVVEVTEQVQDDKPKPTPPRMPARPSIPQPEPEPEPAVPVRAKPPRMPARPTSELRSRAPLTASRSAPPPPPGQASKKAAPARPPAAKLAPPPTLPPRPTQGHPLYHYMVSGPKALIQFDWEGPNDEDLTVRANDVVKLTRWASPEWLEGECRGKTGIFPAVFADILEDIPVAGPRVTTLFDFQGEVDHELTFEVGETIRLLGHISADWMRGEYRGKLGAFPAQFVQIDEDLPEGSQQYEGWPDEWASAAKEHDQEVIAAEAEVQASVAEASSDGWMAVTIAPFESDHGDDLTFVEGEQVHVLQVLDADWLYGCIGDRQGTFPSAFVDQPYPPAAANDQSPAEESEPVPPPASGVLDVDVDEYQHSESHLDEGAATPVDAQHVIALHAYEGGAADDLVFDQGAIITVLDDLDSDWYFGELDGHQGMFPKAFVEPHVVTSEAPKASRRRKFK
eukprot:m.25329 g.25329  ORF g.25329 m.25329 type:complete len:567 (+) comp8696_c0_seq1:349-2049(+)